MSHLYIHITKPNTQQPLCWYNNHQGQTFEVRPFKSAQNELLYEVIKPTPFTPVRGDVYLIHPQHCEILDIDMVSFSRKTVKRVYLLAAAIVIILALIYIFS